MTDHPYQPIRTAPRDGTPIIIRRETARRAIGGRTIDYDGYGRWYEFDGGHAQFIRLYRSDPTAYGQPTHWRPT